MHAKDVIRNSFQMSTTIVDKYLGDLDDAAFLLTPVEGMNPIAWQIGHLIVSERGMMEGVKPGASPALPEGFEDAHPRHPDPKAEPHYRTTAEYLSLFNAQRAASLAILDDLPDDALDAPSPEKMRGFMPTVGHIFNTAGMHPLMHAGQFVAVRRALQKPIAF